MAQGRPRLVIPHPWASWRATFGYVDDVAAGVALAAVHPRAGGETYNLGRSNTPTNIAWAASFAEHLNWPGDVQLAHPDVARGALAKAVSGLDLDYPLFIDNAKIRRRLGYCRGHGFRRGPGADGGGRDGEITLSLWEAATFGRTLPARGALMTTSRTWPVWLVCLLAAMIEGFDIQSMGVAAPRMLPALHLTPGQAGWAFSASLIGLMVGASFGGVIADRSGGGRC
jgi:hypothetical protein